MRSRRRRALLPLRATPHVAWPPFFRPAHAAGCAAAEAARRAMDQGSKGPRVQGAASMSAAVNRESHAFRPAGTAPLRRRSGTAHGLMHQPSTCVACRETMAGAEYCTCRLRSVASRSPRRRGRIRNVLCDGRRRGRSAAFAVRRSPLAARCSLLAARATKHHARRRCGPRRAHAADRPPRSFRSAHRLARDSCPLARARPRSRTGG